MATILDGTSVAARRRVALKRHVSALRKRLRLGIILATDNAATHSYVGAKHQAAEEVGVEVVVRNLGAKASTPALRRAVEAFNRDRKISGFIVQLPLPSGVDPQEIFKLVDPAKDADGLTPTNLGYLFTRREQIVPATPKGIVSLLDAYEIRPKGKKVAVVGKGLLTGLPIATMLAHAGATVTNCDKHTKKLAAETRSADIVIAAAGVPGLITAPMIKPGAIVVDVGSTKLRSRLHGDVDFDRVAKKARAITPVPGGVGPMTVVSLLENLYQLAKGPIK